MIKNEPKDMYATAKSLINKKMFTHLATEAGCRIIADYINDYPKSIFEIPSTFNLIQFSNMQLGNIICKRFIISMQTDILKIDIQLLNNKWILCKFYKSGKYHISGFKAISKEIQDHIISWGTGIMKKLK